MQFDQDILVFFHGIRNPTLTIIMKFFSFMGMEVIVVFSMLVALYLLMVKKYSKALLFMVTIVGGAALNLLLKLLIVRPRPTLDPLVLETTYSFPSGHSMNAMIFYLVFAYIYRNEIHRKQKSMLVFFVGILIIALVGISRIYLGVHYPSDVIAGYFSGLVWLIFIAFCMKKFNLIKT